MNLNNHNKYLATVVVLTLAGCAQPALTQLRSRKPADVRDGVTRIIQEQDELKLRQAVPLLVDIFYWTTDQPGATSQMGLDALDALDRLQLKSGPGLARAFAAPRLRKQLISGLHKRYQPGARSSSPDRMRSCSKVMGLMVRQWPRLSAVQQSKVVTVAVRQRCTKARSWLQKRFKQDQLAWYGIMAVSTCSQLKKVHYSFKNRTGLLGTFAAALHQLCALDRALVSAVGAGTIRAAHPKMRKFFRAVGSWPVPHREDLAEGAAALKGPLPTVARKLRLSGIEPNVKEAAAAFCAINNTRLQAGAWKNFQLRSGLLGRLLLHAQIKADDCLTRGCPQAEPCTKQGLCSDGESRGLCIAGSDEDCAKAETCTDDGRCKAEGGACVAADDKHCKASTNCRKIGNCTAKKGSCVAGSDDDCQQAEACIGAGRCKAKDGTCGK